MSEDLRIAAWLGAASFVLYALLGHGHFKSSDEIAVYETTRSLWERGDLVVQKGPHVFGGRDGQLYSHFAIGQSVLALPFYGLGRLLDAGLPARVGSALGGPRRPPRGRSGGSPEIWAVLLYPPCATALLVAVWFLFQRALGVGAGTAALASALVGAGTYLLTMSTYFLRHSTEALTILGALYGFHCYRRSGSLRTLALASAVASLTLLVRVPAAVAAPGLAGYLGFALFERVRAGAGREHLVRAALAIGGPLAVALAIHVATNQAKWGTWWSSPMLGQVVYFDTPLHVGLRGLLLSPGASVFAYSPLLLVCPWLLLRFWSSHRAECATLVFIVLSFLVVCAQFFSWSGLWAAPGPRYLFVATPLLLLPLGLWLDGARRRGARGPLWAALGLAVAGFGVQLAVTVSDWNTLVDVEGWRAYEPGMEFLFVPSESPILGGVRGLLRGHVDGWIWWIAQGWRGHPPNPLAAASVWLAGLGLLVFCVRETQRCLRHAEGGAGGAGAGLG